MQITVQSFGYKHGLPPGRPRLRRPVPAESALRPALRAKTGETPKSRLAPGTAGNA